MIELIVQILDINPWYGVSENIEIARGKYKLPESIKEGLEQRKRKKWQLMLK